MVPIPLLCSLSAVSIDSLSPIEPLLCLYNPDFKCSSLSTANVDFVVDEGPGRGRGRGPYLPQPPNPNTPPNPFNPNPRHEGPRWI
jgi:hypothetical protein